MYCSNCGLELSSDASYCTACGNPRFRRLATNGPITRSATAEQGSLRRQVPALLATVGTSDRTDSKRTDSGPWLDFARAPIGYWIKD